METEEVMQRTHQHRPLTHSPPCSGEQQRSSHPVLSCVIVSSVVRVIISLVDALTGVWQNLQESTGVPWTSLTPVGRRKAQRLRSRGAKGGATYQQWS